jgi:hypothetical protein
MPGGLTGIDLLSEIAKRGFGCPVIIMTAQGTAALRDGRKFGRQRFSCKTVPSRSVDWRPCEKRLRVVMQGDGTVGSESFVLPHFA